jgi:trans-aconitate methyltransferase
MPTATPPELDALYRDDPDPWNFATSAYEHGKYRQTIACLPRPHYRSAIEVGCSIAVLGRMIATRCDRYLGIDASRRALAHAARQAPPNMRFRACWIPGEFPAGRFDLVVLSEILYFLAPQDVARLAARLAKAAAGGDILCVNMLGPTDRELDGTTALNLFAAALNRPPTRTLMQSRYRIDVFAAQPAPADG